MCVKLFSFGKMPSSQSEGSKMLHVYAVLDKAVDAFMPPFFVRSQGEAVRTFADAVNDKSSPFFKHVSDFELFKIGTFDPANGQLTSNGFIRVLSAMDVVEKVT